MQKAVDITEENWKRSKIAAEKCSPKSTRPKWINKAIEEQAKREGVK